MVTVTVVTFDPLGPTTVAGPGVVAARALGPGGVATTFRTDQAPRVFSTY